MLGGGRLFPTFILNLNEDGLSDKRAEGEDYCSGISPDSSFIKSLLCLCVV